MGIHSFGGKNAKLSGKAMLQSKKQASAWADKQSQGQAIKKASKGTLKLKATLSGILIPAEFTTELYQGDSLAVSDPMGNSVSTVAFHPGEKGIVISNDSKETIHWTVQTNSNSSLKIKVRPGQVLVLDSTGLIKSQGKHKQLAETPPCRYNLLPAQDIQLADMQAG